MTTCHTPSSVPAQASQPGALVARLPPGPCDIIGDVHGECEALEALLQVLGYDAQGRHPDARTLVFVGDLVDRGPDSVAVVARVHRLVEQGRALAILGNHELNLLCDLAKDGSGWFFDDRVERDNPKYAPYRRAQGDERQTIRRFLSSLPLALEREDLRIVHAAWMPQAIDAARTMPAGTVRQQYDHWESLSKARANLPEWRERLAAEAASWPHGLDNPDWAPPFMPALAEHNARKQMDNPVRVLTSGVERVGGEPFYASGLWRFVSRVAWWDAYADPVPVVVGHYWRCLQSVDRSSVGKGGVDLFEATDPLAWHGCCHNVFCVDFSVGGRWRPRREGRPLHQFKLAALRWPERELVFDDGRVAPTHGFAQVARSRAA